MTWDVGGWGLIHGRWGRRGGEGGISICVAGRGVVHVGGGVFANGEKNQDPNRVVSWCEQTFQHCPEFCFGVLKLHKWLG